MLPPIKRIIIADDDEDDIFLFRSALEETCPELLVTVVNDGVNLLSLLNKKTIPDAIFLDLNMPLKSGKECLHEIRRRVEFDDIPIIILSTSSNQKDIDYCLSKGATHYFVKPNTFTGLKHIVQSICNGVL